MKAESAAGQSAEFAVAYKVALKYLARREHSRAELNGKLLRRFAADVASAVLDELADSGMQSDARFAAAFVRGRRRKFGEIKIAAELRMRGIAGDLIKTALAASDDDDSQRGDSDGGDSGDGYSDDGGGEIARARAVLQKRFGVAPADAKQYARQGRFLQARGFSAAVIGAALRRRA
jgi:regulatory protein